MITTQTQTKTFPPAENVPVIDEVLDSVTGRRDGEILPCVPVLFTGRNLMCCGMDMDCVRFYLSPLDKPEKLIPVGQLYRYENTKILLQIPSVAEGEYRLVAQMTGGKDNQSFFRFPTVLKVKDLSVTEIIWQRRQR